MTKLVALASIAGRLTALYAAATFILISVAIGLQYRTLADDLASGDDQLLIETATAVRRDILPRIRAGASPSAAGRILGEWAGEEPAGDSTALRLLDDRCIVREQRALMDMPAPQCAGATDRPTLRSATDASGRPWRVANVRLARTPFILEVLLDRSTDAAMLSRFRRQLYGELIAALFIALLLGYVIARRGLRPLDELAARVEAIDANSLGQRLDVADAPSEVRALSGSFDAMLRRLDAAFAALSSYSADMAHELRTPLHSLRQQVEVALSRPRTPEQYRELLGSNLEEIERLRRMTDDILFLARAEDPRAAIRRERLPMLRELESVRDFMEPLADSRGIALDFVSEPGLSVDADQMLLRRALVNVLSNALEHTPAGGAVMLTGARSPHGASITVEDNGHGIAPADLPHVFRRFYRAGAGGHSRAGAGLGLAIVEGIVRLHGGSVAAESGPGRTTIRIELPENGVA